MGVILQKFNPLENYLKSVWIVIYSIIILMELQVLPLFITRHTCELFLVPGRG